MINKKKIFTRKKIIDKHEREKEGEERKLIENIRFNNIAVKQMEGKIQRIIFFLNWWNVRVGSIWIRLQFLQKGDFIAILFDSNKNLVA